MQEENLKDLIKKVKEEYRKIGFIQCPAFNNEKIYFTNRGFNHLIKKNRKYRISEEQIRRLKLFPYIIEILKTKNKFNTYRITNKQFKNKKGIIVTSIAHFWSFKEKINNRKVIVIICQINKESKIFISVMDKKIK